MIRTKKARLLHFGTCLCFMLCYETLDFRLKTLDCRLLNPLRLQCQPLLTLILFFLSDNLDKHIEPSKRG